MCIRDRVRTPKSIQKIAVESSQTILKSPSILGFNLFFEVNLGFVVCAIPTTPRRLLSLGNYKINKIVNLIIIEG